MTLLDVKNTSNSMAYVTGIYRICLGVAIGISYSSVIYAKDLIIAYQDAVIHDAQYSAALSASRAGTEKAAQGLATLLPTVSVNANTTWNRQESLLRQDGATTVDPRFNSNGWTVQLTQPLFRWQNWVAYQQGELSAAGAELQAVNARQELMLRVSQAYFDVLLAQESLATSEAQLTALREQLASAKRSYELGTATITDSHEAQSRFDLATAQVSAAESELEVRQHALQSLTGKAYPQLKGLRQSIQLQLPSPNNVSKWLEQAENDNLNVQLAQNALEISTREAEKQKAAHLPTLDLVATRGQNSQTTNLAFGVVRPGSDVESTTVGLQLTMPIYSGGGVSSRSRETVALREKALADLDHAKRTAALNARQAYLGVASGISQIRAYSAARTSSQLSLDSNKLAFQVGLRVNIDVLNAQGQLYDTRQKLAKAQIDTLLSQLKLKAAVGSLGEEDMQAVNKLLE